MNYLRNSLFESSAQVLLKNIMDTRTPLPLLEKEKEQDQEKQQEEEWEALQKQWNGTGPMLLDAIRKKRNMPMDAKAQHFWMVKYETIHEELIQNSMRFQLR